MRPFCSILIAEHKKEPAMLRENLTAAIEDAITACEKKYNEVRHDPYLSHVAAAHLDTLGGLYKRLTDGMTPDELTAALTSELPELIAYRDAESEHPSFDWYNEHYHYLRAEGRCDAYEEMIGILNDMRCVRRDDRDPQ